MLIIVIVVGVVLILFVILAASRPGEFRVTRSATMSAPAEAVFARINDLHQWEAWSPWARLDPAAKNTYDGPPSGVGAGFAWSGDRKVGEGSMRITETRPPELIRIKLTFVRPFKAANEVEFHLAPQGGQTSLTWSMAGKNNFFAKAAGLFLNFHKMIGSDFEKGLAAIKEIVEATPKT